MQSKYMATLCALALICLFVPSAKADDITINNPNFAPSIVNGVPDLPNSCGTGCAWNVGDIPGWAVSGFAGSQILNSTYYDSVPGPGTMAYINGGTISQDLGVALQADSTYTLSVYVGHRGDDPDGNITTFSFGLDNGTMLSSMSDSTADIAPGTFQLETYSFTTGNVVGPGDLVISLGDATNQADFTGVSLSVVPTPEPSSLIMLSIGLIGLLGLAKRYGFKPATQVNPVC